GDLLDAVANRKADVALELLPHVLSQPKSSAVTIVMALATQTLAIAWGRARRDAGASLQRMENEFFALLKETGSSYTGRSWGEADPRDSLFLRARGLVLQGNGAAGRALVDSQLTTTAGTPEYANALYWRAALAATAADAERGYRQVIVEYPFSRHSGDALLALAQLEMARGDRDPAIDHLQRFLLQHPNDPERIRVGIWLGRLLLDQNQPVKGCAVLLRTRAALGDTAVETRNQIDYYAGRCADVDTVPAVTRPTPPPKAQHVDSGARRRPILRDSA